MAKAVLPSADAWPAEGLPIGVVCEQNAGALWDDYVVHKRAAARDLVSLRKFRRLGFRPLVALSPAAECRVASYRDTQAILTCWLLALVQDVGFELWGRLDSRIGDWKCIPTSALAILKVDLEEGTANGVDLPPLYDVRVRRANASAVDPIHTGAPGRPTPMHLVEAEGRRRIEAGEVAVRPKGRWKFSENLAIWWDRERPRYGNPPPLTAKTVYNSKDLRELWNSKLSSVARPKS